MCMASAQENLHSHHNDSAECKQADLIQEVAFEDKYLLSVQMNSWQTHATVQPPAAEISSQFLIKTQTQPLKAVSGC